MILTNINTVEEVKQLVKENLLTFDARFRLHYLRLVIMVGITIFVVVGSVLLPIKLLS